MSWFCVLGGQLSHACLNKENFEGEKRLYKATKAKFEEILCNASTDAPFIYFLKKAIRDCTQDNFEYMDKEDYDKFLNMNANQNASFNYIRDYFMDINGGSPSLPSPLEKSATPEDG